VTAGEPELRGRLHPLAILVFARRLFRESVLPLVVLLFAAGPRVIVPVLVVGLPLAFAYLALQWARFEYAVEGERLVVRRGVLSRRTRIVPLDRIRGVDVRQPVLHRLLGLVQVDVEAASGGSARAELGLAAVTPAQAEALRARVVAAAPRAGEEEPEPSVVLYRATPRLLALAGMTSWRYVLAPLAVLGLLANVVDDLPGGLGEELLGNLADRAPTSLGGVLLAVLGVLAVALALGAAGSLLVDWEFTLLDEGERLSAARGLLTRRTVSIERARVRGADVRDTLLSRWAGIASVGAVAGGIQGREGGRATLAPAVRTADVAALVRTLEPAAPAPDAPLVPHPPAARPRRLLRATALPLAAVVLAAALGWWWVAAAALGLLVLAVPLALDRYRQLGHRFDGRLLVIRGGSLLRRWTVLDPDAIVAYELKRSPGQRRAGLCTLMLHLGQGTGSRRILDAGEEQARVLLAALDAPLLGPLVAAAT
jgi:putative membrane protein